MNARFGFKIGFAIVLAGWTGGRVHANPLKDPLRLIDGQRVDLAPLFHWWTNRSGPRPLTAWVRITGEVVSTGSSGWVIDARIEPPPRNAATGAATAGAGHPRVLLKHAPAQELAEFNDLTARLKSLEEERHDAIAQAAAIQAHIREVNAIHRRSRAQNLDLHESRQAGNQAKMLLASLGQQIKDCQHRLAAFPNPDKYTVDCLALGTGWVSGGLPLYDCGAPVR